MSRQESKKNAYLNSVVNVKLSSINKLRDEFKNVDININKFYDTRVYFDGKNEYYPYMFSKTLNHNETTGFALKSDINTIINA